MKASSLVAFYVTLATLVGAAALVGLAQEPPKKVATEQARAPRAPENQEVPGSRLDDERGEYLPAERDDQEKPARRSSKVMEMRGERGSLIDEARDPGARPRLLQKATGLAATAPLSISGKIRFDADYEADKVSGQVPTGTAKVPFLFVCAWERDDQGVDSKNDFELSFDGSAGTSPGKNDDFIGCDTASVDGDYSITGPYAGPDLYLVTYLCDGPDGGEHEPFDGEIEAKFCVRDDFTCTGSCVVNRPLTVHSVDGSGAVDDWLTPVPTTRKVIWSRTYWGKLSETGSHTVSWNLSCPNKDLWGVAGGSALGCGASAGGGGVGDSTNSSSGYNKEAVHVYRAAAEPRKTGWNLRPTSSNTINQRCTTDNCRDEINLHVVDTTKSSNYCHNQEGDENSHKRSYDRICIGMSAQTPSKMDPYRVVHEIGHSIQRRWMVFGQGSLTSNSRKTGGGVGSSSWQGSTCQKQTMAEGWANFVSAAAWNPETSVDATYSGNDIEDSNDPGLWSGGTKTGTCNAAQGEGRAAQFFWDLWDANDEVDLTFTEIRKIFGLFSSKNACADGSNWEGGAHGRNVDDYYDHYNVWRTTFEPTLPSIDSALTRNCMDNSFQGLFNDSDGSSSDVRHCEQDEDYSSCP